MSLCSARPITRSLVCVIVLTFAAACAPASSSTNVGAGSASPPATQQVPGGCRSTQVMSGPLPGWSHVAAPSVRARTWALGQPADVVIVFWTWPLHARQWPAGSGEKTMFIVRSDYPQPLAVFASKWGVVGRELTVDTNVAAPGAIYTAELALPETGCWHLALAWGRNKAVIDLQAVSSEVA